MNIYGDWGNTLALQRRLEWRGFEVELLSYNPGDNFPKDVDIIVGGGGQDSGQSHIEEDLKKIGHVIKELVNNNVPMLVVCGLYQLFGHYFKTKEGRTIHGIDILDVTTVGGNKRLIGNVVTKSDEFGEIAGYENHSGLTLLGPGASPFGQVIKGAGNNGKDSTEGARYRNVIGTYLHGSLLPKNPTVTDFLIQRALENRKLPVALEPLDDSIEKQALRTAIGRPR